MYIYIYIYIYIYTYIYFLCTALVYDVDLLLLVVYSEVFGGGQPLPCVLGGYFNISTDFLQVISDNKFEICLYIYLCA